MRCNGGFMFHQGFMLRPWLTNALARLWGVPAGALAAAVSAQVPYTYLKVFNCSVVRNPHASAISCNRHGVAEWKSGFVHGDNMV